MIGFPGVELLVYVVRVDSDAAITVVDGPYSSLAGELQAHLVAAELHRRHPELNFDVVAMAEIEARA